jgi:bifunctional DNA-binding transcriptional regulator/antitoxin component of YhaV-PrlF toxin-antitoxin module
MAMSRRKYVLQESGAVTLPADFRKKYSLEPGDEITFIETDEGLLISPREALIDKLLGEIGDDLRAGGITLEDLMDSGRDLRAQLLKDAYGIDPDT